MTERSNGNCEKEAWVSSVVAAKRRKPLSCKKIVEEEFWAIWVLRERRVTWAKLAEQLGMKERTLIETWFRLVDAREAGAFRAGRQRKKISGASRLSRLSLDAGQPRDYPFKTHAVVHNFAAIAKARASGRRWKDIGSPLGLEGETVRRLWQRAAQEGAAGTAKISPRGKRGRSAI